MTTNNEKRKKALTAVAGIVGLILIYFLYQHIMYVSTDNAQIDAPAVMLTPKVGGYITTVNAQEGHRVKKGDVLVEIDDRDYQNTLKQIQGELSSLQASRLDAEKNYKRLSSLFSSGAVSQQQFDAASTAYSNFKAKYDAVAAQVAQAQLNLDNTKIRAPDDGIIARKAAEVGQLASPGVPLVGFVGNAERWVTANFKETEVESVKVGAKAYFEVDAISGREYEGTVTGISSATGATFSLLPPDNATGNFTKVVQRVPVKIKIEKMSDQDLELLRAGLSVIIRVKKH
jgi:membrane fusion protein (multidrug efflux system)